MESTIRILNTTSHKDIEQELKNIGVSKRGQDIMREKLIFHVIKIEQVDTRAANILKQTMLSQGAEAAVSASTVNLSASHTDVIVGATLKQLRLAIVRLKEQPWGLKKIGEDLENMLL